MVHVELPYQAYEVLVLVVEADAAAGVDGEDDELAGAGEADLSGH